MSTRPSPSLWNDQIGEVAVRPALDGDASVDIAVIGGGYTGLWTALYLRRLASDARVMVIEANRVGYGASGRNGGWCIGDVAASEERWRSLAGPDGARRMHQAMVSTLDEIRDRLVEYGIECDWSRGGALHLARNGGQAQRLRREVTGDMSWLDAEEASARVGATSVQGALFDPHTAALHPGKLVTGLAAAAERMGVKVVEGTRALAAEPGAVTTDHGTVTADHVVVATEAYTGSLRGRRRDLVPFYSLMLATEPLPPDLLAKVGLEDRATFTDGRYRVIYGQRTADGRIAFGGRAASYRYGSKIDRRVEENPDYHRIVHSTLLELFPFLADVAITHRWGGVLGVPRNWTPAVSFDRKGGVHRAGGYVGEGVAASNLAGRCLAHAIAGTGDPVTTLPWVRSPSRRWPIEPFRWLGITAGAWLFELADRREAATDRPAREAEFVWRYLRR
ncbi:MAG: FAD-dependent oxidoreductase [Acidimicrobiia bacterium]|nr:FAD-dependent oxidoreductase [Acidimicrobiia bacterium]